MRLLTISLTLLLWIFCFIIYLNHFFCVLSAQQVIRTEMYLRTVSELKTFDLISHLNTQQCFLYLFVVIYILICFYKFYF